MLACMIHKRAVIRGYRNAPAYRFNSSTLYRCAFLLIWSSAISVCEEILLRCHGRGCRCHRTRFLSLSSRLISSQSV
jgi:hypothetical protein